MAVDHAGAGYPERKLDRQLGERLPIGTSLLVIVLASGFAWALLIAIGFALVGFW